MAISLPNQMIIKVIKVGGVELGLEIIDYIIKSRNIKMDMESCK